MGRENQASFSNAVVKIRTPTAPPCPSSTLTKRHSCSMLHYIRLSQGGPMSVRKREWTTRKGDAKSAWVVDYVDQGGKRRLRTFAKKKEADAFAATATVEVRDGVHTPASASVTVADAAADW